MKRLLIATILALLWLGGCAGNPGLMRKATADLKCPEDDLDVSEISETTLEVRGCGKQGVYTEVCGVCTGTDCGCAWMLSDQGVDSSAPPSD